MKTSKKTNKSKVKVKEPSKKVSKKVEKKPKKVDKKKIKKLKSKDEDESTTKCDSCTKKKCTHCIDKVKSSKKDKIEKIEKSEKGEKKTTKKKVKTKRVEYEAPCVELDEDHILTLTDAGDEWYSKPISKSCGLKLIHSETKSVFTAYFKNTSQDDDKEFTILLVVEREGVLESVISDGNFNSMKKAIKSLNEALEVAVNEYLN